MKRWLGLKALVHDGVDATLDLVREGHESTSRAVLRVTDQIDVIRKPVRAVDGVRRLGTDAVLGTIRAVNRTVAVVTDVGIELAAGDAEAPEVPIPMTTDVTKSWQWVGDAAMGAINGAVGDHLAASKSGLDLAMVFRVGDRYVPLEKEALAEALATPSPRVVVFVHGLGATEWSWCLEAQAYHGEPNACFGSLLQRDLGITPIFVRYNSGRHVSENGRLLAAMLEDLFENYPVPIDELALIGHSMGGLVVRSASHYAETEGHAWPAVVKRVFYLASPHRGAPLARFGHLLTDVLTTIDLPATRIIGQVLDGRSSGVKDLRHGGLVDEEWFEHHPVADRDSVPISSARHYFMSATVTEDPAHPLGVLIGDLFVHEPSASGAAVRSETFDIQTSHYGGVLHHHLQNHPAVYAQIRAAFE